MSTEARVEENQHFSVAPTEADMSVLQAKEILRECLPWVEKGCVERDAFAYALKARIGKFIECA